MKKRFLVSLMSLALFVTACNSVKTNTDTTATENKNRKANLIDGTWEANYIMNSPKPFDELYPKNKPSVTFNSLEGQLNGSSGCNNFTGKCIIEGKKLQINEAMALTRKMCPDMVGEQTFLETLKKVNSYSVTNQGKTLNLLMGDIAVMRLIKK